MDDKPIVPVPAPWRLKGTVYMVSFWCKAGNLPKQTYSPLERDSPFAAPESSGRHIGGLGQIQIIRYTESPIGPYDELIVCPGAFAYEKGDEKVRRTTKKNARITRIYVSQKYTCWNGRTNWNIPKHLAKFEWGELTDGSTSVKVYPHDTSGDVSEAQASDRPLFQATFQPIRWAPRFPFSLSWLKYIGFDASLVQPPLPAGDGAQGELPGTDRWARIMPAQSTRRAMVGWVDMSQRDDLGSMASTVEHENFWPGLGRWQVGVKLENADVDFGLGEYWDPPRTKL
ncbi:Uu.00g041120.m01.CDS01 [Anthostomella pinea]|uniref:Uu.00g041120.m01.CDS01 n=1 Tax=Anthostomella pinea TaxID=933095 RepID=A0AAI8VAA9_9PEZI|nr:Uu.00g041120.m01.CDS01 [Anthostomella pinea]